jgi:hypothetical protein
MRLGTRVDQPAILVSRLGKIAQRYLPTLGRAVPSTSLAKVLTADTYWRFYSKPEVRDAFLTSDDFVRYVDGQANPDLFLLEGLTGIDPLIAWERSWLTRAAPLRTLTSDETIRALEMTGNGPLVIFEFERADLVSSGVTIRNPCSLDAALGPHYQWRPEGPLSGLVEYIDGPIPHSALTRTVWRH